MFSLFFFGYRVSGRSLEFLPLTNLQVYLSVVFEGLRKDSWTFCISYLSINIWKSLFLCPSPWLNAPMIWDKCWLSRFIPPPQTGLHISGGAESIQFRVFVQCKILIKQYISLRITWQVVYEFHYICELLLLSILWGHSGRWRRKMGLFQLVQAELE